MIRRASPLAAAALIVALALAGCTPAPEAQWREDVQRAATQASGGDYTGADATLLEVETAVSDARDSGGIDAARAETILAAAATVRADLAALLAPAPEPSPSTPVEPAPPAETPVSEDGGTDTEESGSDDDGSEEESTPGNKGNNGKNKNKDDE